MGYLNDLGDTIRKEKKLHGEKEHIHQNIQKKRRRSGLGQKRIHFLTTLYGIFHFRCAWMEKS